MINNYYKCCINCKWVYIENFDDCCDFTKNNYCEKLVRS